MLSEMFTTWHGKSEYYIFRSWNAKMYWIFFSCNMKYHLRKPYNNCVLLWDNKYISHVRYWFHYLLKICFLFLISYKCFACFWTKCLFATKNRSKFIICLDVSPTQNQYRNRLELDFCMDMERMVQQTENMLLALLPCKNILNGKL